jgi:hypothetical protein
MSDKTKDWPQAETIRELDIHLGYMRGLLQSMNTALEGMATTKDIERLTVRIDLLEQKVDSGTVSSTLDKALSMVTRLAAAGAALAAFGGVIVAIVHFFDKVK